MPPPLLRRWSLRIAADISAARLISHFFLLDGRYVMSILLPFSIGATDGHDSSIQEGRASTPSIFALDTPARAGRVPLAYKRRAHAATAHSALKMIRRDGFRYGAHAPRRRHAPAALGDSVRCRKRWLDERSASALIAADIFEHAAAYSRAMPMTLMPLIFHFSRYCLLSRPLSYNIY